MRVFMHIDNNNDKINNIPRHKKEGMHYAEL